MAQDVVSDERWKAGADYLAALRKLGLDPEGRLWAFHQERKEMVLAMVSSLVERIGPREVYQVLFEAYEKAGTPQSVDPWIVTAFAPGSVFNDDFEWTMGVDAVADGVGDAKVSPDVWFTAGQAVYTFKKSWVYVAKPRWRSESKYQMKVWNTFKENVSRLTA